MGKNCANCNNWSTPYWKYTKAGENGQCYAILSMRDSSMHLNCVDGNAALVTLPTFGCSLFEHRNEKVLEKIKERMHIPLVNRKGEE